MAIQFESASGSNFRKGRGNESKPTMIIIHVMQGSFDGTRNWFKNSSAKVSAHYLVGKDGRTLQMVLDKDTAWHCKNVNQKSIGIEHEGFIKNPNDFTDEMLNASAKITRELCKTYSIPIDRNHIKGHNEVPGNNHTDPGKYWPWEKYMNLCMGKQPVSP